MKKSLFAIAVLLGGLGTASAQQLELSSGGGPTGGGPIVNPGACTFRLNNVGSSTFSAFSPATSVQISFSNQQYVTDSFPGMTAGGTSTAASATVPGITTVYQAMSSLGSPANAEYTSGPFITAGTGFSVADNYGYRLYNDVSYLQGQPLNGRYYYGDMTITFSRPVVNPVIHLAGIGAQTYIGVAGTNNLGYYTEFDLSPADVSAGYSLTKLSGTTYFNVTTTSILNSSTTPSSVPPTSYYTSQAAGNSASGGSVRVNTGGNPVSSVTFKVYVEGDGGVGTGNAWMSTTRAGDGYQLSTSLGLYTVSGNVFNDVNGLSNNTINGVTTNLPSSLYANLVDANGNLYASAPVAGGAYSFSNVVGSNYTVVLTTSATSTTAALPANWITVGENLGTTAGTDGTADGMLSISVGGSASQTDVVNANFGIQQPPTAGGGVTSNVKNPGSTTQHTVPATTFTNTTSSSDPSPGAVTAIRITAFPAGAASIVIDGTNYTAANFPAGGVVIPSNATGQPAQTITVDPDAANVTTVSIPFKAIDAAGAQSANTGSALINFVGLSISGFVYNDVDGLSNSTINGVNTNLPSPLYVNLLHNNGNLYASTTVTNGTYLLQNVTSGNYTLVLTTSATSTSGALPANWLTVGENLGATAGSDGAANGMLDVFLNASAAQSDVVNANFGIQQPPTAGGGVTSNIKNPGGTVQHTVPATTFSSTTSSSDPAPGAVTAIRITAFPTGATSIAINSASYTAATFPAGGVVIPASTTGQPTQTITVDPIVAGVTTVSIPFKAIDAAGAESANTGSAVINFIGLSIRGNVYNDVNGLSNNTINGVATSLPSPLYANLVDGNGNLYASAAVTTGSYSLTNVTAGNYTVVLTTSATSTSAALPANWVTVGENLGATTGSDGTANGMLGITIIASASQTDVSNANFGIQQPPTAGAGNTNGIENPGDTTQHAVPATAFSNSTASTDPTPGTVTAIRITALPAGATSIVINGTKYTSATFPAAGVVIPSSTTGQPTQTITVDPVVANVTTVSIPFKAIDAAGAESANTGSAVINFVGLSISGKVLNDHNGGTINGPGFGNASGAQLYVNLVDPATGLVLDADTLSSNGQYHFSFEEGVEGFKNYTVVVSTTVGVPSTTTGTASTMPASWVYTAEGDGGTLGDGTPNGIQSVSVGFTSAINKHFSIERAPTTQSKWATVTPPAQNQYFTLNGVGSNPPVMTGSDAEDMPISASLAGKKVAITSLPNKGKLWYNGTQVTVGQDAINPPSDTNPLVITNLDPTLLQFQASGTNYTTASFTYAYMDEASVMDPVPATYTIDWNAPLPVVLTGLDATGNGCNAVITWETSSEANLASYEVQHSSTGKDDFLTIASVNPKGNGSSYEVLYPQTGIQGYYRLKMIERSGTTEYSTTKLVTIQCDGGKEINVYPNPTNGVIHIQGLPENAELLLYDFQGRIVSSKPTNSNDTTLDLSQQAAGTYQIVVIEQGNPMPKQIKVVKQ